jgi:uncharacterized membrane protein
MATEVIPTDESKLKSVNGIPQGSMYKPLPQKTEDGYVTAHAVQTILADPQRLYTMWREVESTPRWQEYVVSVKDLGAGKSHWVMGNPEDADGKRVEFDSQIERDEPGKRIGWKSITEGVEQEGVVTFEPSENGRGTRVTLIQKQKVPGGALGNAVAATAKRGPKQIVIEDLRHFKEMAEAGEIPSVVGQPHGPRGATGAVKEWMLGENNPTPPGSSEQR